MFIYLSKPFDIQEPVVLFALCGSSRVWNQESPVALKRSYISLKFGSFYHGRGRKSYTH